MPLTVSSTAQKGSDPLNAGDPVLDVHSHVMPLPLLQRLADRGLADVSGVAEGIVLLDPQVSGVGPKARLPLARSQYDTVVRLSEMDLMGVRRHAVAMPPFLFCSTSDDPRLVADVISQGNDELATYVADDPDRLLGLASVPLGWPGAADEARRALDDLGLAGITIGTRGAGKDLDDPVNDDLWALLTERDTFIFMHPSGVPDGPRLHDFYLAQLLGYPMETAIAVSRLVFGGKLEKYPLTLCLAHGGGCLPGVRGRLDMGWERKDVAHTTPLRPSDYTNRLYYDTAVFSPTLLRRLIEDVGADHVLLGTDHPFELGDRTPRETVTALGLDRPTTQKILWENADALLGLPVKG